MIEAIDITGVKYDLDETTKKYVAKKIGRLDRYLPKHARKSVNAEVKLKEVNRSHGNKYEAEVRERFNRQYACRYRYRRSEASGATSQIQAG
jgi:ribosome-associated translation inhibitor RaiA